MAIREDLVSSAVTFLQDASVASAPVDKRIAFLQSKNLTQEEIDAALARAGDAAPEQVAVQTNYSPQSQQVVRQPPPPPPPPNQYAYNGYPAYWQQQPPPQPPRRDWRDYFIMGTVMSGVGYGLYFIAKRYIIPIIAPPTPPQLEQDKAAVDEAFNRAFTLIEQLSNDTASIKASEEQRTEKLDEAIADFERTINNLKEASRKRDDDTRRLGDDVRTLQDMIPRAMKTQEKTADDRLKDLGQELKSLKTLLNNRVSSNTANTSRPTSSISAMYGNSTQTTSTASGHAPTPSTGSENASETPEQKQDNPHPLGRFASGKGGIPSWQMAAQKTKQTDGEQSEATESNTTGDASASAT